MNGKAGEWQGRGERGRPPSFGQKSVINREVRFLFLAIALRLHSFKSLKTAQRIILVCRGGSIVGVWGAMVQNWILGGIIDFSCEKFLNSIACYGKYCRLVGPWPPCPPGSSPAYM